METATAAYQKKINKIAETFLQDWSEELESTRTIYLRDVFQQGLIWAGNATAIALLFIGGAAYWMGTQHVEMLLFKILTRLLEGNQATILPRN